MITNEIIVRIDNNDKYKIEGKPIDFNLDNNSIFTYTFWDKKELKNLPHFFSEEGLDLFYISLAVFGADRILLRDHGENAWKRNIKLYLPVLSIEKWQSNKELMESILNFLSGDKWELSFRKRELNMLEQRVKNKIEQTEDKFEYDKICMFSGGLDSFIGAIDAIEDTPIDKFLFVSHYGGGKGVKEYQDALVQALHNTYNLDGSHFFNFYASTKNGKEDTTRTRSLMFFSHAIVLGTTMKKRMKLFIPENGLISLNIPLTNSRLGSSSTRTTHPYYMELLQRLLVNLNLDIILENPYQFKTKGEMIEECKNIDFLQNNLENTMSCSHPDLGRMQRESETSHCGTCLPCVIRRASIKKANIKDTSIYRDPNFESGLTARVNLMSYNLGLQKYNKKFSFISIQNSGTISKDISEFVRVYDQGMEELKYLLESVNEEVLF